MSEEFWPWEADGYEDDDAWHQQDHPVWREGCPDCIARADRLEAEREAGR